MFRNRVCFAAFVVSLGLTLSCGAVEQTQTSPSPSGVARQSEPTTAERQQAELNAAWSAAAKVATQGPANVKLIDQGAIAIPEGIAFIPSAEAASVLRAYGNVVSSNPVGLLTGTGTDTSWLAVIRFIDEGYIKDDDAKDWNADDLLANIKQGTEDANEERAQRGFPKLQIIGWVEKPAYDSGTHRLVWSLESKSDGEPDNADRGVNYDTYALGREGYFSLNMLTTQQNVEKHKPIAQTLLSNLNYDLGKRYSDFDSSTDKVAAYGIAALVGGVAAKKLGIFAVIVAFAAKFAKVGILAIIALGAGLAQFFKRKPKENPAAEGAPSSEQS